MAYRDALAVCGSLLQDPVGGYFCIGPLFIVAPVVLIMETSRACAVSAAEDAFCRCMSDKGYPVRLHNAPMEDHNGLEERRD